MLKNYLECGKIINKRGIGGELKLLMLCDDVSSLKNVKTLYEKPNGENAHSVTHIKSYKEFLYIKLSDVNSAESADALRGKTLYAKRDELIIDDSRVFIADILNLPVKDAQNGKIYGILKEVFNSGASDIYRIVDGQKEYLMPAVKDVLCEIKVGEHILVNPIPGIFDDAEEIH